MKEFVGDPLVRVFVCGNADRGDDGVALATVATVLPTLPDELRAKLDVRRCLELRTEDLVDLPGDSTCLIVDAVVGVEPGQVVQTTLTELTERPTFSSRSSHHLPIELVIGLAGILRGRKVTGSFVGLGGRSFGYGTPLTPVVRRGIPAFRAAIAAELANLVATQAASEPQRSASPANQEA